MGWTCRFLYSQVTFWVYKSGFQSSLYNSYYWEAFSDILGIKSKTVVRPAFRACLPTKHSPMPYFYSLTNHSVTMKMLLHFLFQTFSHIRPSPEMPFLTSSEYITPFCVQEVLCLHIYYIIYLIGPIVQLIISISH